MNIAIADTTADDRMTGLERFLEFWLGPRLPEYGEPAANLEKMELPDPLRRLYAFAGRWPPADPPYCASRFHVQDRFLPFDRPSSSESVHRSGPYLVFVVENQSCWEIATLPNGDDPSVWLRESDDLGDDPNLDEDKWQPLAIPLSQFLVTFVLQETIFSSQFVGWHEQALSVFADRGCDVEPILINAPAEYAGPGLRHSYSLIDRRILLCCQSRDGDDWTNSFYGFNDATAAESLERLNLPSKVR